ncbi:MAG: hypothetical protein H7Y10_03505 [Flavobacterium sp.]|nr:hypothetical protein [Flavobacterium sp.]
MKNLSIISKKVEISLDYNAGEGIRPLTELERTTTIRFLGIPIYRSNIKTTLD